MDVNSAGVRQQSFECGGPVELDVEVGPGRVRVELVDETGVSVRLQHDPDAGGGLGAGLAGLLSWLGGAGAWPGPEETAEEAVRRTTVEFSGRRLLVRTPAELPWRTVPVAVTVTAPAGSSTRLRTGSADVAVAGPAGRVDAGTGSGNISVERCDGDVEVRTGSGQARLGSVGGRARVRTGSGDVTIDSTAAAALVTSGSGDVHLGTVGAGAHVRTGSGDLTVIEAHSGELDLLSGSGQLRVGIATGVRAELDVSSGAGSARCDLPPADPPAGDEAVVRVRARSGSGDALVTAAG